MAQVKIYGASDDLVEVEGDHGDEWGGGDSPSYVVFSTGDRFSVRYDSVETGIWRVEHVHDTGKLEVRIDKVPIPEGDEEPDPYSDVAHVSGDFGWIDCWREWPPEQEEIIDRIENYDLMRSAGQEALLAFYNAAKGR